MMKKWIMVAAMALSMVVTAQQAQAENDKDFQPYLGIGISSVQWDFSQTVAGFNSANLTGFIVKGGIDMYRNFGVEVRGLFTGSGTSTGIFATTPIAVNLKITSGFSYLLKLQAPFDNGLRLYALLGRSQFNVSAVLSSGFATIPVTGNASSGSYGAGIAYDADNGLSIELEGMRYAADISAGSLFASFRF